MLKVSKTSFLQMIAALTNPIAGVLYGLLSIIIGRTINLYALTFSIALIYSYLPILWDVRSNYFRLAYFREEGLNPFQHIHAIALDATALSYQSIVFLTTLTTFFAYSLSINRARTRGVQKAAYPLKTRILFVLLLIAIFEYRTTFDLQKTTLALSFFILGVSFNSNITRVVLFSASSLIHPFVAIAVATYLLSRRDNNPLSLTSGLSVAFALLLISIFLPKGLTPLLSTFNQILPERLLTYLLIQETRYSSDAIALLVRTQRVLFILIIYALTLSLSNLPKKDKKLAGATSKLCLLAILFSFNEVFLERFFIATTWVAAILFIRNAAQGKLYCAFIIVALLNSALHGGYTLRIIFSERYEVTTMSADERIYYTLKPMYLPSAALLNFEHFGYSDSILKQSLR